MDPINNLARAYGIAHQVTQGVSADRWSNQSPCDEWDARAVAAHIIGGAMMVSTCVPGGEFDHASLQGDIVGEDPAASVRAAADAAVAAIRDNPQALGGTVKMPFGEMPGGMIVGLFTTDAFVHAWDLAKATGQSTDLDPELAMGLLAASRNMMSDAMRKPGFFAAEQTAPEGAPVADQLAAFLGRSV